MSDDDLPLREALLTALRRLDALGMNRGSTGNVSHRATATDADTGAAMWITPTGMGADDIGAGDFGPRRRRWREPRPLAALVGGAFHRALYAARPELNATHCHSPHATALACLRRALPAFHYMVAVAGGDSVRLACRTTSTAARRCRRRWRWRCATATPACSPTTASSPPARRSSGR
ncbi:MAG: class II aldolase/adducin family protein [Rubrivivax sp.]